MIESFQLTIFTESAVACWTAFVYLKKGYILFLTKFIGSSPNFNDASPNIVI
jgi:hypothetical protein